MIWKPPASPNARTAGLQLANRRTCLRSVASFIALSTSPGLFAEELALTPRQTEGPFYPDQLPLDTDNDLLLVNDAITPAVGEVTHLTGRVLDATGQPVGGAVVEIWQCDGNGVYLHTRDAARGGNHSNFQGFGRFLVGRDGAYYFRTIKPVPYPGRTPHIHVKVRKAGRDLLTTQCYVKGFKQNQRDGIYRGIRSDAERNNVTVDFKTIPGSGTGELAARFDIVLGLTPQS